MLRWRVTLRSRLETGTVEGLWYGPDLPDLLARARAEARTLYAQGAWLGLPTEEAYDYDYEQVEIEPEVEHMIHRRALETPQAAEGEELGAENRRPGNS